VINNHPKWLKMQRLIRPLMSKFDTNTYSSCIYAGLKMRIDLLTLRHAT
jgi:hypothetical protein